MLNSMAAYWRYLHLYMRWQHCTDYTRQCSCLFFRTEAMDPVCTWSLQSLRSAKITQSNQLKTVQIHILTILQPKVPNKKGTLAIDELLKSVTLHLHDLSTMTSHADTQWWKFRGCSLLAGVRPYWFWSVEQGLNADQLRIVLHSKRQCHHPIHYNVQIKGLLIGNCLSNPIF